MKFRNEYRNGNKGPNTKSTAVSVRVIFSSYFCCIFWGDWHAQKLAKLAKCERLDMGVALGLDSTHFYIFFLKYEYPVRRTYTRVVGIWVFLRQTNFTSTSNLPSRKSAIFAFVHIDRCQTFKYSSDKIHQIQKPNFVRIMMISMMINCEEMVYSLNSVSIARQSINIWKSM